MKKLKYLVLGTALCAMLMGSAYAAWDESFTVKNTVEAGELKVVMTAASEMYDVPTFYTTSLDTTPELKDNVDMVENNTQSANDLAMGVTKDLTSRIGTDENTGDNSINFRFQNLYPGCEANTYLTAENQGTMPAVFDTIDMKNEVYQEGDTSVTAAELDLYNAIVVDYEFLIKAANGTIRETISNSNVTLANLETALNTSLKGKYLLPGEELISGGVNVADGQQLGYNMQFSIPETSLIGDQGENELIEFDLEFNFVQHNMYGSTP